MITPAGKECRYFYGDYYRGRQHEECRLLEAASPPQHWSRDLCTSCPVPEIIRANACETMILVGRVERPFPFLKRAVRVKAHCTKTQRQVAEPQIGCGECHPLPPVFLEGLTFGEDKPPSGEKRDPDTAGRP
jgi:hypothetical protein